MKTLKITDGGIEIKGTLYQGKDNVRLLCRDTFTPYGITIQSCIESFKRKGVHGVIVSSTSIVCSKKQAQLFKQQAKELGYTVIG